MFLTGIMRFAYSLINGCNMEYRFLSSVTVRIFGEKVLAGGSDVCIVNRFGSLSESVFYILRPMIIGCGIFYLYLCFKGEEHEFPVKVKTTVLLNSLAGVVLAAFTIYQIMTSF